VLLVTHAFSSLDELGDGYGFRKIRNALAVEAFGVNAIVFPARYEGPEHFHDTQDELYFVHKGRIRVDVDGESRELGEGGLFHASATTPRRISNAGDADAIVFVVGGKGGYVERDGHLVNPEVDLPRRQGLG
jgi:quercetin dioxygenase-like cupin family protein